MVGFICTSIQLDFWFGFGGSFLRVMNDVRDIIKNNSNIYLLGY